MSSTTSPIPEAPREVRWATLLRERRPLAGLGFTLTGVGSVCAVLGFASGRVHNPFDDVALDSGNQRVRAVVHAVEVDPSAPFWLEHARHAFTFTTESGRVVHGESWAEAAVCAKDDVRMVEYLPSEPTLSRLEGTRRAATPAWLAIAVLGALAGGFVLLISWLRQVIRLRIALGEGRLTTARIAGARAAGAGRWRVEYHFSDPDGTPQRGRQTLRATSAPAAGSFHPVIHDERSYTLHRLVGAEDFLTS